MKESTLLKTDRGLRGEIEMEEMYSEHRPEWNADAGQVEFAVFCVENLADDLKIDPTEAYDLLTVKTDILSSYIIPCYDALHTQGKDYIMDDIKQLLKEKGVPV